jgi:hypothetical protein
MPRNDVLAQKADGVSGCVASMVPEYSKTSWNVTDHKPVREARHCAKCLQVAHLDVALDRNSMVGIEPIASAVCDRAAKCR